MNSLGLKILIVIGLLTLAGIAGISIAVYKHVRLQQNNDSMVTTDAADKAITDPAAWQRMWQLYQEDKVAPNTKYWNSSRWEKVLSASDRQQPIIVLIIDDLGVNQRNTKQALSLPSVITFSFLPYAPNLDSYLKQAHDRGHEVMLHLPMQPQQSDISPGPQAITADLSRREISNRIERALATFYSVVGKPVAINNHMGSGLMQQAQPLKWVLEEIKDRDIPFIDSLTTANNLTAAIADDIKLKYITRDLFLDNNNTESAIELQWERALAHATSYGASIVIAHPYDITMSLIPRLLKQAEQNNVKIVPISYLLSRL